MAKRIDQKDIERINEVYSRVGTYAATARETGFAASTVKKYIVGGAPVGKKERAQEILPKHKLKRDANWDTWLLLSDEELEMVEEFRKELTI